MKVVWLGPETWRRYLDEPDEVARAYCAILSAVWLYQDCPRMKVKWLRNGFVLWRVYNVGLIEVASSVRYSWAH